MLRMEIRYNGIFERYYNQIRVSITINLKTTTKEFKQLATLISILFNLYSSQAVLANWQNPSGE